VPSLPRKKEQKTATAQEEVSLADGEDEISNATSINEEMQRMLNQL
ncbi:hypothetical protein scyTo_0026850, partial [Scyliorhinus torazame]|nr:hypothetical protein [Scyliorhinus torazame]